MIGCIYNSITPIDQDLINFSQESHQDDRPAAQNMHYENWVNKPHTMLYKLYKEQLFDGDCSGYITIKDRTKIIAGSGFHPLFEDTNMIATCIRAYTLRGFNQVRQHGIIQNCMQDIAKSHGMKGEVLTFNEYNLELMEKCYNINLPDNYSGYFQDSNGNHWRNSKYRITPWKKSGPYNINYTKQWMLYHMYDHEYESTFLKNMKQHIYA